MIWSSPQARSRREGIHDWVRGEAPRELGQIRKKTEPNPVRDQSTVVSNSSASRDGPNSKTGIGEDTIRGIWYRAKRDLDLRVWLCFDGLVFLPLNYDECSFLVFVKWKKTFPALQFHERVDCVTRYWELIRSPLVPIALNGIAACDRSCVCLWLFTCHGPGLNSIRP